MEYPTSRRGSTLLEGTTYTYDKGRIESCCLTPGTPPPEMEPGSGLVRTGNFGSGILNNGLVGNQSFLDSNPRPLNWSGEPASAYQIEGDAEDQPTLALFFGMDPDAPGPMLEMRWDLGEPISNLDRAVLHFAQWPPGGIGLPQKITFRDGENVVVDTTFDATSPQIGPKGRGQYIAHEIDMSSLSGEILTLTLEDNSWGPGGWISLNEVQFFIEPALQAGDANQDLSFDQQDILQVLFPSPKYLSGEPATWGEGDWNGAPGGSPGDPPTGDGLFDQFDLIAALKPAHFLAVRTLPFLLMDVGAMRKRLWSTTLQPVSLRLTLLQDRS